MTKSKTTKKPATPKAPKTTKTPKGDGSAKKPRAKKAAEAKPKKVRALDAAAKVLAGSKEPMNTKQMIETMAAQKLWTSPSGKTPHATLFSAIMREVNQKGKDSRFKKVDRGLFTVTG